MRYCIGCQHWTCHPGEAGRVYSTLTADSDTPAQLACKKGYWREELSEWHSDDINTERIYDAMCLADTCADFIERPSPQHGEPQS